MWTCVSDFPTTRTGCHALYQMVSPLPSAPNHHAPQLLSPQNHSRSVCGGLSGSSASAADVSSSQFSHTPSMSASTSSPTLEKSMKRLHLQEASHAPPKRVRLSQRVPSVESSHRNPDYRPADYEPPTRFTGFIRTSHRARCKQNCRKWRTQGSCRHTRPDYKPTPPPLLIAQSAPEVQKTKSKVEKNVENRL